MNPIKKSFQYGSHTVTFETGEIARQASGAVMVSMGDTQVFVTVVGLKRGTDRDFFPLTVDYQERTYAAGTIPGGFFRREGRPSENETLLCRLIDRPIRPLFPKGFTNEVQIIATVVSLDAEIDPDIPALLGASVACSISGLPFSGPVGAARVGYINGEYVLNPDRSQLEESDLNLVVAGTSHAVLMVESEAKELPEDVMLGSVIYGHEQMQVAIKAISELAAEVNTPAWEWESAPVDEALSKAVADTSAADFGDAYQVADKQDRYERLSTIRSATIEKLVSDEEGGLSEEDVRGAMEKLEKKTVRSRIIEGKSRIDGRDTKTVRPITVRTGVLPRKENRTQSYHRG